MRKQILIIAKTYPTRSKKYTELVCTAGVDRDGTWYRIYPIPSKNLQEYEGLKKYTWIDAEIEKDKSDPRVESYKINISSIKLLETIGTDKDWSFRKDIVLKTKVYYNMKEIINLSNNENSLSLCLFKAKKYLKVYFEKKEEEEFNQEDIKAYKNANLNLFEHNSSCEVDFNIMPKLSHSIKIVFEDENAKKSKMTILDWEINQLFLKYKDTKEAKKKVKDKLLWMFDRDLYLCLGTMRQMHGWTSNPFTIIGLFYPPKVLDYTPSLF